MHDPSVDQFFIKTIKDGMVIWGENTSWAIKAASTIPHQGTTELDRARKLEVQEKKLDQRQENSQGYHMLSLLFFNKN
jgi:hypothetical protein